jgi:hypothetical protein
MLYIGSFQLLQFLIRLNKEGIFFKKVIFILVLIISFNQFLGTV